MVRCQRTLAHGLPAFPSPDALDKERPSSGIGRSQGGIGGSERTASGGSSVGTLAFFSF